MTRTVKNLKKDEVIEYGRVVGGCIAEAINPMWKDCRYFRLADGLILLWLPKAGLIDLYSEVDPFSATEEECNAMWYKDLPLEVGFEELAEWEDGAIYDLLSNNRITVEDYYKALEF